MIKLNRHYAEVLDITDPDKLSKIKIKILPEFNDMSEDLLPWAKPFITTGMSSTEYDFHPPTVGSKILVLADPRFRTFYYVHGIMIEGLFDYDVIKTKLDTVSEMTDTEYPNVDFTLLNDGSLRFNNRETGEMGVVHSSGTYMIMDADGNVFHKHSDGSMISKDSTGIIISEKTGGITMTDKDANEMTMSPTGILVKDKNGNEINMLVAGIKLKTGDSTTWMPNILPNCLFTGAPHGGAGGGITKLTGG